MDKENFHALDALRSRIFCAQRDLIERAGGYKRVMDKTGRSKSEVNRWQGGADQDFMPPLAIAILENDCGYAIVTAVMAEASGRRLTDPDNERQLNASVMAAYAKKLRCQAESANTFAAIIEDEEITVTEAQMFDRKLADEETALANTRATVAAIKAKGGTASQLKVVGE